MIHLFMRAAVKKALNNGAHCFPRFVRAFRSNSRSQMHSSPHDIIRFELRFCHRRAPSFEVFDQVVGPYATFFVGRLSTPRALWVGTVQKSSLVLFCNLLARCRKQEVATYNINHQKCLIAHIVHSSFFLLSRLCCFYCTIVFI